MDANHIRATDFHREVLYEAMNRPDQILAVGAVDAGLAADARIDVGQQRGRNHSETNAQDGGGGEAGNPAILAPRGSEMAPGVQADAAIVECVAVVRKREPHRRGGGFVSCVKPDI